jgi:hypothetical protein
MPDFKGTIQEAANRYPETRSRTFRFDNKRTDEIFFMLKERPDTMVLGKKLRSIVTVLCFHTISLDLYKAVIPVLDKDVIIPITLGKFNELVVNGMKYIEENPAKYPSKLLAIYEEFGFSTSYKADQ